MANAANAECLRFDAAVVVNFANDRWVREFRTNLARRNARVTQATAALVLLTLMPIWPAAAAQRVAAYTIVSVAGDTALRGDRANRLTAVVWYPAATPQTVAPIDVGPPGRPYFSEGTAAKDARLADTPAHMPFIVVSHGTGGSAMDLAWLCAGLAAHGYIVAAVNHPGNNALEPPTVAGTSLYWLRADDVSRVITGVLALPRFGSRIDRARIGAAGESLGGFTALELAGAETNDRLGAAYCARKPHSAVCTGQAAPAIADLAAKVRALAAASSAYRHAVAARLQSYRDPRMRAIFSIEPALGPQTISASLAAIRIPVALVAGFGDRILPVADNVIPDALALAHAELTILPKPVGHYAFLIDCTALGRRTYASICQNAGAARREAHRRTLNLARSFFDRTLIHS